MLFYLGLFLGEIEPAAAFAHLPKSGMLAFTKAVEISLGRITLQSAEVSFTRHNQ